MIVKAREVWQHFRILKASTLLILAAVSLTLLGFVALMSVGQSLGGNSYSIVKRQLMWAFFAVLVGWTMGRINLDKVRHFAYFIGAIVAGLLLLVLIPSIGIEVNGARRWLGFSSFHVQVSDLAKVILVFVLARYLADHQRQIKTFYYGFFIPSMIIGFVCVVILLEPDFGTAFLCGAVGYLLLFLVGVRLLYFIPTVLFGGMLFAGAIFLDPIRMRRVLSFLDVEGNKSEGAYQLWQGMLAFAAGGLTGTGLGNGRQQMGYLPEAHTDFIFPIIGEELGFIFTGGVVLVFLLFFITAIIQLRKVPNLFYFCLVMGALLFIVLQAMINIGVVTGMLPTKGMSLPFISYGGSNLISMFMCVGVMVNCFRKWQQSPIVTPRDL